MPNVTPAELLADRARGRSFRELERRYGLSRETCRRIVLEAGKTLIADMAADIEANGGRTSVLIPWQPQDDWMDALVMLDWSVEKLREQGLAIEVERRRTPDGLGFELRRTA